ncbi:C39 family peptidase [Luteolibacter ambystomatis]|uniref:C39 family peptidase n=1 Tax=Luteolibacter ambystomatis TaxID=2824561 RepID=A0A975G8E6_9BACT|nr:C39 family peptidase [Luteolibacter ambystomatis]QUE50868.1 C39 family peptidase [Luteolibacter ambystomatis]
MALLPFSPAGAAVGDWRQLGDGSGAKIDVRFEGKADGIYLLRRRADGRLFEVKPDFLLPADQKYFDEAAGLLEQEITKLNGTAGHKLFSGAPFEARAANGIASALSLREESSTNDSKSWRLYAGDSYRLFDARPYSVALYADGEGHATSLSIVYANKGDFGSKAGTGQDHFEGGTEATANTLEAAMKRDEAAIEKSISEALGAPVIQRFGEGKTRRQIKRWDWNGQSLLLSSEEGEYVSLQMVPLDFAAAGGKTIATKGEIVRRHRKESVVRESNGDVYATQIPMVDQGPKGYCVPATFERAMRTMGIDADMYLLAMIGGTGVGGGTSVEKLLENVRRAVYSKGRRTKDEPVKELRIRDVKRYIDEGVPVMWTMHAVDEYAKAANDNTSNRKLVSDWSAYITQISTKAAEIAKLPKPDKNGHICMIIGYNEKTDELAVSDSWGPSFERRWVPTKIANWASSGGLFMILP